MSLNNSEQIKYELDVIDKMIDHIQRKIRSNESIMGMVNSTYEYETFTGYKTNQVEIDTMKKNVKMLGNLLDYRAALMDYAVNGGTEPTLEKVDGFKF